MSDTARSIANLRGSADIVDRLLARTKRVGECWIWTAPSDYNPRVWLDDKTCSVRRLLYVGLIGPLSDNARLTPACTGVQCVNPHHCHALPPGNKRELSRAARRAAAKPVAAKTVVVPAPAPVVIQLTPRWADGTHKSWGNAFTAAPRASI